MKTMKFKSGSLFWILGLLLISINSNSQESKLSRQERKEVRKAERAANFYVLDSLLNAKTFVLEADFLQNKIGDMVNVVPSLNFIKVDVTSGVLQTGTNSTMGYNGVGGVTAEGSIGKWVIYKDEKNQSFRLQFSLLTNIGFYDINMSVSSDNRARATISGLGRGQLTWDGHLETIGNARVFKGQNSI
jgi:hypothetical protein